MRQAARVTSIDAVRGFKAALIEFIDESRRALGEVDAELQRAMVWVETDRMGHWKREIRKRQEKVAQAKSDLYRAQLQATDHRPDCVDERKALAKAQHAFEEAEQKLERCRGWARQLNRELILYKGQSQPFASSLYGELPRAVSKLDHLIERLEAYIAERGLTQAPPEPEREAAASVARAGQPSTKPGRRKKPKEQSDERERRQNESEERAEGAEPEVGPDASGVG